MRDSMKKPIITLRFIMVFLGIFLLLLVFVAVRVYLYVQASQLKITEDVHVSDSILLQKEFGIDLPPEAEITRFGYSSDRTVIRIEGVTDLNVFLTETLHWELDEEEAEKLSVKIIRDISGNNIEMFEDMYGKNRIMTSYMNSEYQTDPVYYLPQTRFFLIDEKLVIEISKERAIPENRTILREIVNR
jgi:hypothetical protein